VILSNEYIEKIKQELPELPQAKAVRYQQEHQLTEYDASVLTSEKEFAEFYEQTIKITKNYKAAANWIMTEVMREIGSDPKKLPSFKITPAKLGKLISMIDSQEISGKIAKQVFSEMLNSELNPEEVVKQKGLVQISDSSAIEKIVDQVLAENQKSVDEYKAGKVKLFGFFVGAVMKATKGQANPDLVNELLKKKL
jgi:aspartyl-tRNA(Asn)/glutamyl-tRNA(Gln) amidotransferase subunit B